MNDQASGRYPFGPSNAPISYWHLWAPIFRQLGIDPAEIPDFAPLAAPQGEGLPAWQRGGEIYEARTNLGGGLLSVPDQQAELQRRRLLGGLLGSWST